MRREGRANRDLTYVLTSRMGNVELELGGGLSAMTLLERPALACLAAGCMALRDMVWHEDGSGGLIAV